MIRMIRIARRVLESTIQGAEFISENRLVFKSIDARKGFCMQQNDIAVLRRCQRFFLLGLLFYDDASDFVLRDCSFTTVPGQLFYVFDMKHTSLHCKLARIAVLRRCQANFFLFFYVKHKSPHW